MQQHPAGTSRGKLQPALLASWSGELRTRPRSGRCCPCRLADVSTGCPRLGNEGLLVRRLGHQDLLLLPAALPPPAALLRVASLASDAD